MYCKKKGKLVVVSGPSGSGKSTIVKHLLSQNLNLVFSVSACTRLKRKNEKDGKDYFFHASGVSNDIYLKDGDNVEYKVVEGERGPKAVDISPV